MKFPHRPVRFQVALNLEPILVSGPMRRKNPMRTPVFLIVCLALLLLASKSFAQQSSAINGAVTDESGGVVPNAQVMVTNTGQGTVFTAITNNAGEYSVPALE